MIEDLLQQYEASKRSLIGNVKEYLTIELSKIFTQRPGFRTVYWTQYTPYFNDGDTCEFSADISVLRFDEKFECYGSQVYSINDSQVSPDDKARVQPIYRNIRALLSRIPEEILRDTFGDHAKVIYDHHSNRITIEHYDHE